MKAERLGGITWLVSFVQTVFLVFLLAAPLLAEEGRYPGETGAEEIRPKETVPAEPLRYIDLWGRYAEALGLIADVDAYYTYSEREGGDAISGGGLSAVISPMYRFSEDAAFLVLYNGDYYRRRNFYSDLVGPRETDEFQSHTVTPTLRIRFGERSRFSVEPSLFYTTSLNKDVEGGGWRDGLYNYRDKGGGLDLSAGGLGFGEADGTLRLGAQYYEREYPNYESLLDLATGLGIERDVRDYDGLITKAGYTWTKRAGLSWGLDYYLLYKDLRDKKVVDSDGVLSSDEQRDWLHSLNLRWWYVPNVNKGLRFGLDLNGGFYRSNQNYYDGMGTMGLADDVFIDDFYDFDSYGLRPNISYTFNTLPFTASLAYSYQKLNYLDRMAQRRDGTYKGDEQEEIQNAFSFRLSYAPSNSWSFYLQSLYLDTMSNNDYSRVYNYDYTINNYSAGFIFRYK